MTVQVHVLPYFVGNAVPGDCLLREGISLWGIFVFGRLVSEWLYEFICKYLNVGSFVGLETIGGVLLLDSFDWNSRPVVEGVIVLFGDDNGWVSVSPEDPLVPHEVVIDQFSRSLLAYISSSYCYYGYYLYLFLGFTTFGAAENY